jgi:hypothetical protein
VKCIPYWHFLSEINMTEFEKVTRKVIRTFGDKLVLAISDELPPMGELSKMYRVPAIIEEEARLG